MRLHGHSHDLVHVGCGGEPDLGTNGSAIRIGDIGEPRRRTAPLFS
ncbi:hypothetical protein Ae263Ps1_2485c [Pseudonocardia sp. Ae263_Ps1]|nr:hypothetical protein Ae263Ps1_2485c [Pseudonocardia sp. Ae263_Ps1]